MRDQHVVLVVGQLPDALGGAAVLDPQFRDKYFGPEINYF
jgi:hypothetical protein